MGSGTPDIPYLEHTWEWTRANTVFIGEGEHNHGEGFENAHTKFTRDLPLSMCSMKEFQLLGDFCPHTPDLYRGLFLNTIFVS